MSLFDRMIDIKPIAVQLSQAIGFFVLLKAAYTFLVGIYARLLRPGKNLKSTYGKWGKNENALYPTGYLVTIHFPCTLAVITGATDGIGKAMAFELARKGLNVVLLSRTKEKLEECKGQIQTAYPKAEVLTCPIDFSTFDTKARESVAKLVAALDVGVLVNNVGISYPYCQYFHELDDERVAQLMSLNVDATTWMTRIVLPKMVEQRRGAIVNIGSGAAHTAFVLYCPSILVLRCLYV
jgi:17beta-estradiol 17-dehydrogenase / very-long-chain 3-oxoacyl-CoA reductase